MGLFEKSLLAFATVLTQMTITVVQAKEYCAREKYWCETGHCCGSGQCCNYYYELWWFWVIWIIVLLIGGCCAWQRRRVRKLMRQQNRQAEEIQTVIQNSPPLSNDWFYDGVPPWKLPSYADIGNTVTFDTPPPPYAQLNDDEENISTQQTVTAGSQQQQMLQQRLQQQRQQQQSPQQRSENAIPQIMVPVTVHCEEVGTQASEAQIQNALTQNNRELSSSQIINVSSPTNTPDISPTEVKIPLFDDSPTSNEPSPIGAMAPLEDNNTQVATEATETEINNETENAEEGNSNNNNSDNNNRPRFRNTVVELCGTNQSKAARV